MRGNLDSIATLPSCHRKLPLIRPVATFPRRGKALPKRLLPPGEAAARRRLMRGSFNSIIPLPSCRRKLAPHPACGHLPPEGEGSPQKAFPPGRSCRPQAADEGGVRAVSLLKSSTRRLSPHPSAGEAADTFSPRGGRLLVIYLLAHTECFKHFINRCRCRILAGQITQRLQGVRQADGGGVQPKAVLPCADGFGQRIPRAGRG